MQPPSSRRPRVLIVDDDDDGRELHAWILDRAGFEVDQLAGSASALARARQTLPDAIVLDHQMPGIDGVETSRRLRADAVTHAIPLLMLSGIRVRAAEAPWDAFLEKPCTPEALVAALRALVRAAEP